MTKKGRMQKMNWSLPPASRGLQYMVRYGAINPQEAMEMIGFIPCGGNVILGNSMTARQLDAKRRAIRKKYDKIKGALNLEYGFPEDFRPTEKELDAISVYSEGDDIYRPFRVRGLAGAVRD